MESPGVWLILYHNGPTCTDGGGSARGEEAWYQDNSAYVRESVYNSSTEHNFQGVVVQEALHPYLNPDADNQCAHAELLVDDCYNNQPEMGSLDHGLGQQVVYGSGLTHESAMMVSYADEGADECGNCDNSTRLADHGSPKISFCTQEAVEHSKHHQFTLAVDYFEDGDMAEYHNRGDTSACGIQSSTYLSDPCREQHHASNDDISPNRALEMQLASSTDAAAFTSIPDDSLDDQPNYPKHGDVFHVWTRSDKRKSESSFLWAWQHPDVLTSNTNGYYAEFDWDHFDDRGGEVTFGRVIDGTFETLSTISVRFEQDKWYQLEVEWEDDSSIMDVHINDKDCNGLNGATASIENRWDTGGVGFIQQKDSDTTGKAYYDHVWIDRLQSEHRPPNEITDE